MTTFKRSLSIATMSLAVIASANNVEAQEIFSIVAPSVHVAMISPETTVDVDGQHHRGDRFACTVRIADASCTSVYVDVIEPSDQWLSAGVAWTSVDAGAVLLPFATNGALAPGEYVADVELRDGETHEICATIRIRRYVSESTGTSYAEELR